MAPRVARRCGGRPAAFLSLADRICWARSSSSLQSRVSVSWTSLWSSAMGMVGCLDLGTRSRWRLAQPEFGCICEDLLGNDCSIGGCHGRGAEAENAVEGH